MVAVSGPDHARHYIVDAIVAGCVLGRGDGPNRREAETAAATQALGVLDGTLDAPAADPGQSMLTSPSEPAT